MSNPFNQLLGQGLGMYAQNEYTQQQLQRLAQFNNAVTVVAPYQGVLSGAGSAYQQPMPAYKNKTLLLIKKG